MTEQVADVALRLGLVVVAQVRNGEGDVELADVLDGHDAAADAQLLGAERVLVPLGRRHVLVGHVLEQFHHQAFQLVQTLCTT